ncbi:neogenin-like [Pollicipes pollicipes]|uniref:neogenin-like n=1 Tax=Pollicipes pollicipes TaxID=41117 RepID=UPI0018853DB0|nr:neogenin-like [Pollicipes pollicipes]
MFTSYTVRVAAVNANGRTAEYLVRMAALTVNGTGPYTRWHGAQTFHRLQVEAARPTENTITVLWSPPENKNIRVRGYTIGWGRGIRTPSTWVSLRALNAAGNGTPIYETVWTRQPLDQLDRRPLVIPTGGHRRPDLRGALQQPGSPKRYRHYNASQLNCMIEGLRPATTYEFSVQAVKGRRESDWSLVVVNQTRESAPASPPRDLTIVQSEDNPAIINLNWQPPKTPNGKIDGYVIQYTPDRSRQDASGGGLGDHLLYVIIACSVTLLLVIGIIAAVCLCKRKTSQELPRRGHKSNSYVKGQTEIGTPDLKPPDLWIHHDQMELRPIGKQRSDSCSTLRRQSPDYEVDERSYASTLDRRERAARTHSPVVGKAGSSATALANGTVETRPVYPRTQFSISRNVGSEPPPPPLKRPSFACAPRPADGVGTREELTTLRPSCSTEELTQEMANLEGLMKDLNAITASEFKC